MNVSQNNLDAVNAKLLVKIEPADYTEKVEKAVKDFRKKANMPGFRPGTVPVGLVKKMYGKSFLAEEVNKLISDALYDYIKEKDLNILGEPIPTENFPVPEFEDGANFEFSFDIAIAPELAVSLSAKNKVKYYNITVGKDLIDKQTAAYRGRFGKYVQTEKVEEKDVVKGELQELNADGSEKVDGVKIENALLSPGYIKSADEKKKVIGMTKDSSFVFNPNKAFEGNDAELASLLQISKDAVKTFTADCKFTIKEITRYAEAEMNQEFFDACFGKDVVKSEDEFTAKIKEGLAEQFVEDSDIKFIIDMRDLVLGQLKDVQFADAFLKRWLKANNEKMTAEQIEEEYPKMIEDLKWQLVKDKMAKEADVKVEKADIEEVAKKAAKAQFAQYGMIGVPDDILDGYVQDMLKNKDGAKNAAERAAEHKIVELLKSKVSLANTDITFDEFSKFFEKK